MHINVCEMNKMVCFLAYFLFLVCNFSRLGCFPFSYFMGHGDVFDVFGFS